MKKGDAVSMEELEYSEGLMVWFLLKFRPGVLQPFTSLDAIPVHVKVVMDFMDQAYAQATQ